jgi:large subunit ribosomal protein L21
MFAVIETGGKQYRVETGMKVKVEKLEGEVGAEVTFDRVLMIADGDKIKLGKPYLAGSAVKATLVAQDRDRKVIIFKKRRRKMYEKKAGHRQYISIIRIEGISA